MPRLLDRSFACSAQRDSGTYAIEIWNSSDDARRFAEASAPTLAASTLPPPTRGAAFQVAQLFIREQNA